MGNNPSVSVNSSVVGQASPLAFLHRALVTFVPSTTTFSDAFKASTASWMRPLVASQSGWCRW